MSGRRNVLITGTSTGLGLTAAVHLAKNGFRVFATMRDLRKKDALEAEAAKQGVSLGDSLDILQLDVTEPASITQAVDTVIRRAGSIYSLINNAGVQVRGFFEDVSDAEMRAVFETNFFGSMALTRAVLPHMRQAGEGHLVMVTSVGGRLGHVASSAYCSSKFATEGFGETLAFELFAKNIKVTMVEPGTILTPLLKENRTPAKNASNPASPYYEQYLESERLADWAIRTTRIKSEDVAKTILKALTAKRPRMRYVVGARPGAVLAIRRLLPFELFEKIYFGQLAHSLDRKKPSVPTDS